MAWPSDPVAVGDLIQATQLNLLPVQIADTTISVTTGSISFSSIPSQFAHLLLIIRGYSTVTGVKTTVSIGVNGDSGSNYYAVGLMANASGVTEPEAVSQTAFEGGLIGGASGEGGSEFWFHNYADTTRDVKPITAHGGAMGSGASGTVWTRTDFGCWAPSSPAAISSLLISPSGGSFNAGTRATLYGLA